MRFVLPLLALATLSAPAMATEPEEQKDEKKAEAQKPAEAKDEKICRYIRMDMSSRRKEKVCLTKEGWTEFNQGN